MKICLGHPRGEAAVGMDPGIIAAVIIIIIIIIIIIHFLFFAHTRNVQPAVISLFLRKKLGVS